MIGPLACWLYFEVEHLPPNLIAPLLHTDQACYRRIKQGIETRPVVSPPPHPNTNTHHSEINPKSRNKIQPQALS